MRAFLASLDKYDAYLLILVGLSTYLILKFQTRKDPLNWDHFWQNFDKFLITFMFIFVFVIAVKQGGQIWIQDLVKQLLPAVLALLGARAFTNRAQTDRSTDNGNSNSITTTPKVDAPVTPPVDNTVPSTDVQPTP